MEEEKYVSYATREKQYLERKKRAEDFYKRVSEGKCREEPITESFKYLDINKI